MDIAWQEWLSLIIRWLHVVAGIAWIGTSFYFIWLDQSLRKNRNLPTKVFGESWSFHGGGFYHVQKYLVTPGREPDELHWFKFEAYFTWISGFALLGILYYWSAESFLLDPSRASISPAIAIVISASSLIAGWIIYDLLCRSVVGRDTTMLAVAVFILIIAIGWGLTQVFNDRAALLHVGAVIGTMMSGNVFFVIIPNQKKVIADLRNGKEPPANLGLQAKQRSLHNNYLTLPVVLFMISGHYPILFNGGSERGWIVIGIVLLIGGVVRHFFNAQHAGSKGFSLVWQWPLAVFLTIGLILFLSPQQTQKQLIVSDSQALSIIDKHCSSCHASKPTNPAFSSAPAGLKLDNLEQLRIHGGRVATQAVTTKSMPLGNATKMTLKERAELGAWIVENQ
jgi:uncharacterized membrane protein